MAMFQDQPERQGGVLPPPPSTPDDGPMGIELPPLHPPPRSLQAGGRARSSGPVSVRLWLLLMTLFAGGTLLTYYVQR